MLSLEYRKDHRPPEPGEEIDNWSVQVPLDHQLTFGDLRRVVEMLSDGQVPDDARCQINGNLVTAWRRRQIP